MSKNTLILVGEHLASFIAAGAGCRGEEGCVPYCDSAFSEVIRGATGRGEVWFKLLAGWEASSNVSVLTRLICDNERWRLLRRAGPELLQDRRGGLPGARLQLGI